MGLAQEYGRQWGWRSWDVLLEALPALGGRTVLDAGCALGDQAAALAARGARVLGFEGNEELLAVARSRGIPGAAFARADVRRLPVARGSADGIWASFVAAYLPRELEALLAGWRGLLRPGGWVALVEVDDLFAHEPLAPRTRELLARYAEESLAAGRYDFRMGGRLAGALARAGFEPMLATTLPDRELAFDGPAEPAVRAAWRERFERMTLLRRALGAAFEATRDDFLACLARDDHRALARVVACVGRQACESRAGSPRGL